MSQLLATANSAAAATNPSCDELADEAIDLLGSWLPRGWQLEWTPAPARVAQTAAAADLRPDRLLT